MRAGITEVRTSLARGSDRISCHLSTNLHSRQELVFAQKVDSKQQFCSSKLCEQTRKHHSSACDTKCDLTDSQCVWAWHVVATGSMCESSKLNLQHLCGLKKRQSFRFSIRSRLESCSAFPWIQAAGEYKFWSIGYQSIWIMLCRSYDLIRPKIFVHRRNWDLWITIRRSAEAVSEIFFANVT